MTQQIQVCRLSSLATLPTYGTPGSVGLDLYSARNLVIDPFSFARCPTDLLIQVPPNCYGRITSRSGLAAVGIIVQAGVIDPDYVGSISVLLYNFTSTNYIVSCGDRVAQLICERAERPQVVEVRAYPSNPTARGRGGFGSTGH